MPRTAHTHIRYDMQWFAGDFYILPSSLSNPFSFASSANDKRANEASPYGAAPPCYAPVPLAPAEPPSTVSFTQQITYIAFIIHSVGLIAAVAIVSELFANAAHLTPVATPLYALAPADAACLAFLNGDCVAETDTMNWHALQGAIALTEHRSRSLFSDVNPAVVCLVVQAAVLSVIPPMSRRIGAGLLAVAAILLLFQQTRWELSFGALLGNELLLLGAFFIAGHGQIDAMPVLSLPALMVAALTLAGEHDATALTVVFFSLCGMLLAWRAYPRVSDGDARRWLGVTACLCLLPFLVRVGLRFDAMAQLPITPAAWIWGTLSFALVWSVLLTAGLGALPLLSTDTQYSLFFLDQLAHVGLVLLILIGLQTSA
jgi:hypothetical protein